MRPPVTALVPATPAAGLSRPATAAVAAEGESLSPERQALRKAAQGFEAIMLRRMLESARAVRFTEDTPLTGGGRGQFEKMRDDHFADLASTTGSFGFARSIEEQLAQYLPVQGDS